MANIMGQGQIQVGPSHQARLPFYQPDVRPEDMLEQCTSHETLVWLPDAITDGDLLMFLRAARSMAAFVGWCDGGSTDDGCAAASMDEITINSLHLLHQHGYDTGKALQALVKVINPKSVDKRWSDDDAKKFVRGLKQHGKNFFKIRRDLLSNKETPQLVEYYYLWKKTPAASTTRPHRRHRRPALRRQAPTPTVPSNEEMEDVSSVSEVSEHDSDEEDTETSTNTCFDCCTTKSSGWYEQEGHIVCSNCIRKYNGSSGDASSGDTAEDGAEPPPFMFRPVKEEQDMDWKHSDTTKLPKSESGVRVPDTERTSPSDDSVCSGGVKSPPDAATKQDHNTMKTVENSKVNDTTAESSQLHRVSVVYGSPGKGEQSGRAHRRDDYDSHDVKPAKFGDWQSNELTNAKPGEPGSIKGQIRDPNGDENGPPPPWFHFNPAEAFQMFSAAFMAKHDGQPGSIDFRGFPMPAAMASAIQQIKTEPNGGDAMSELAMKFAKYSERSDLPPWETAPGADQSSSVEKSALRDGEDFDGRMPPHRVVASVAPTQLTAAAAAAAGDDGPPMAATKADAHHSLLPQYPPPLVALQGPEGLRSANDPGISGASNPELLFDPQGIRFPPPSSLQSDGVGPMMLDRRMTRSPGAPGLNSPSGGGCRPGDESESDSEHDMMRRTPSPEPQMTNIECYRSKNAIFMKRWHRGYNSCSRCDFEFLPPPNSSLVRRREERVAASSSHSSSHSSSGHKSANNNSSSNSGQVSVVKDGRKVDRGKPPRDYEEKKKLNTPPENRSSDAQITSSLMGAGHHLPMFGPSERLTPREPFQISHGHDPTPALRQLSEYARPHIGGASAASAVAAAAAATVAGAGSGRDLPRGCLPPYGIPGLPPGHPVMDPFLRMPNVYPPGSREALELEIERDKREREAWERQMRDLRELEFMEKMKQEMDLKLPGFDRLASAAAAGQLDPLWLAELQRRYVTSGGPPPPAGHIPGVFPPPPPPPQSAVQSNVAADLIQRERERIDRELAARSNQEQQLAAAVAAAAAARDNNAIYQLYQRYAHDPEALQHHQRNYLAQAMSASKAAHENEVARMMDASHLVYHFARADPLSAASSSNAQGNSPKTMGGGPPPSMIPPPGMAPPQGLTGHGLPPPGGMAGHPLVMAAREQERIYLELLSRPPYSTDPILAQQLSLQAAAQQEAIQRQLAIERELSGAPPGSVMLH